MQFIRLPLLDTNTGEGAEVLFAIQSLLSISTTTPGASRVNLFNGTFFFVKGTPAHIQTLIERAIHGN